MKQATSKLKQLAAFLLLVALTMGVCTSLMLSNGKQTAMAASHEITTLDTAITNNTREVLSYKDIFQKYYDYAGDQLSEVGRSVPFSYEDFCEGYYTHDLSIADYTEMVVEYTINNYDVFSDNNAIVPMDSSSSASADYILTSTTNYSPTPSSVFKRVPIYNSYDYSPLLKGDIVYETNTKFFDCGHNAIISDLGHSSFYGPYIQTIEAVKPKVSYGFLDDDRMVQYAVVILRVTNASTSDRSDAVYFCQGQVGKPYKLNTLRLNTSYNSDNWYCSELMYAAYYYTGIDVGVKKVDGSDEYLSLGCLPSDIYNSYNTAPVMLKTENAFLDISIVNKSGSTWTIRVVNDTGATRTVYYNSKMCFEDDAKTWTSLNDIKSIYLSSGSSATVQISTNWFATTVAFSYISGSNRYITYGLNLKTNTYTMSMHQVKISV